MRVASKVSDRFTLSITHKTVKKTLHEQDHQELAEADFAKFDDLLREVNGNEKRTDECYQILRQRIRRLFLQKDTNSRYRSALQNDLEDLIELVISRYTSFNRRSPKTLDQKVADFEKTLKGITRRVYLEELRKLRRYPQPITIPCTSHELPQPQDNQMRGIMSEIRLECYYKCLKNLPQRIGKLFMRYYPNHRVAPQALAAMRLELADEESGQDRGPTRTPEQQYRSLNNLQSKLHKWRTNELAECVRRCVEETAARNIELNYLKQQ